VSSTTLLWRLLWLLLICPVAHLLWAVYSWPGMHAGLVVAGLVMLWGTPYTPHALTLAVIWLAVAASLQRW